MNELFLGSINSIHEIKNNCWARNSLSLNCMMQMIFLRKCIEDDGEGFTERGRMWAGWLVEGFQGIK